MDKKYGVYIFQDGQHALLQLLAARAEHARRDLLASDLEEEGLVAGRAAQEDAPSQAAGRASQARAQRTASRRILWM